MVMSRHPFYLTTFFRAKFKLSGVHIPSLVNDKRKEKNDPRKYVAGPGSNSQPLDLQLARYQLHYRARHPAECRR